ncbi:MAG TPA: phosphatase PAP2 family protein [Puia sp.]|nr:phosphatase PAP2 family protein [Puia sp.]
MKAFPNYRYHDVHIELLYNSEKNIFGIASAGNILTPNEYLLQHQQTWLNVITGFFYLCWVPLPLVFAGILFFKNRKYFFYFSLSFLLVNILGFIIYYVYPAAPPWYVQQYGFNFIPATHGNTAGLQRFDDFFHTRIFAGIYSKSSNVFAAMPSLHASYPLLVLFYGLKYKFGYWNLLFFIIMVGIWFAAVYNSHHYVLDVLAGIACGITGLILFLLLADKTNFGKRMIDKMVAAVN